MSRFAVLSVSVIAVVLAAFAQQPAKPQPPPVVKPTAEEIHQIQAKTDELDGMVQKLKAKRGNEVLELPVAVDGLAVYVHESNPVSELTLQQIKAIYTGQIKNWKEVGGRDDRILLYSRENNSGTYAYFKEHVLENADFHPTAQTLPGTAAVINALAKDRRGIGYGGIAYGKGIKHLKVKRDASSPAVEPTMENVLTSKYPISRFLYWYFAGAPTGDLKALSLWVLSKEGQTVVEKVGYYPLSDRDRLASLAKLGLAKDRASVKQ